MAAGVLAYVLLLLSLASCIAQEPYKADTIEELRLGVSSQQYDIIFVQQHIKADFAIRVQPGTRKAIVVRIFMRPCIQVFH